MEERNYNWKKLFKKIILPEAEVESVSDEEPANIEGIETNCSIPDTEHLEFNSPKPSASSPSFSGGARSKQTAEIPENNVPKSDDENKNVPEWNKVFKEILGKNPDELVACKNNCNPLPPVPVLCKPLMNKSYLKGKSFPAKIKMDPEEEKVRKDFASWRLFKKPTVNKFKLNDFDGAGIDIFKHSMMNSELYSVPKQKDYIERSGKKPREFRERIFNASKSYEPDLPLTGVVTVVPYERTDTTKYHTYEVKDEEAWDNDLLF